MKATTARILYCPSSRLVGISSAIESPTIRHPQIIGLRAPNRCSSFSPTRMKATMAMA